MPVSTTVTGMVLSAMPVGDYDKRLVLLTKEMGKITAFAKGAKKPNSALLACSQPFAFGEFAIYGGRSSYSIATSEISNYFSELRDDFEGLCYGFYFCEFADYMTKENNDEKQILRLLYQTLRVLTRNKISKELIRAVYELKIMALNGEAPQVFGCMKCEKNKSINEEVQLQQTKRYYFSIRDSGILCDACKIQDKNARLINTSTLYAMQYIISQEIEKLYSFQVTDEVLEELKYVVKGYLDSHIEHNFKSLDMLNIVTG